jgi:hypothetical protein
MPISTINSKSIADGTVVASDILDGTISSSKLVSANIAGDRIAANTLSNTVFQTGSVESYLRGANLDFGMRNRIINGAMSFDQRNSGAVVTTTTNDLYILDRYKCGVSQTSKFSVQRDSSSNTAAGFATSLKVTSSSSYSVTSSDYFVIEQDIEGYNIADLNWGSANARPVTLSFFVRSSLTGTFGGSLRNSSGGRGYPFTYTISAADTWEQKIITVPGDTTGTWLITDGLGLRVTFGLGVGSSFSGTAGSWQASNTISATGAVSVVGTNAATWYLTGVQLEEGLQATPFEYRHYGTELSLCQRYYQAPSRFEEWVYGTSTGTANAQAAVLFIHPMRASPTVTLAPTGSSAGQIAFLTTVGSTAATIGTHTVAAITNYGFRVVAVSYTSVWSSAGLGTGLYAYSNPTTVYTASAEL